MESAGLSVLLLDVAENAGVESVGRSARITLSTPSTAGRQFFRRWSRDVQAELDGVTARVYHASDVFCLAAVSKAAVSKGAAFTYDARELYPFVHATVDRPLVAAYWHHSERVGLRIASHVFAVNPPIADCLVRAYGIDRPTVYPNLPLRRSRDTGHNAAHPAAGASWPRPGSVHESASDGDTLRQRLGLPSHVPLILHQGQMRPGRGCMQLVDAMEFVREGILVFLGSGELSPRLTERAAAKGLLNRVRFLDAVPPDQLPDLTRSADIGATLLEPTCANHFYARPNKLFEYIFAGIPVIASDLPEIRAVVAGYDVGRVVDSGDARSIGRTLREMLEDRPARKRWSRNCAKVIETFDPHSASQRFIKPFLDLAS